MKIRTNYVSNSSSSSFVIIGNRIDNPLPFILQGKEVYVWVEAGGTSGECEDWSMKLDKESYELLKTSDWFLRHQHYALFFENIGCNMIYEDGEDKLNIIEDISNVEIFSFKRDYSSPNSLEELKQFLKKNN